MSLTHSLTHQNGSTHLGSLGRQFDRLRPGRTPLPPFSVSESCERSNGTHTQSRRVGVRRSRALEGDRGKHRHKHHHAHLHGGGCRNVALAAVIEILDCKAGASPVRPGRPGQTEKWVELNMPMGRPGRSKSKSNSPLLASTPTLFHNNEQDGRTI